MKSPINILPEEWHFIEAYLDQKDSLEKEPSMNEKLDQIPYLAEKMEYIRTVREEIEDSIRRSKIKDFHNKLPEEGTPPFLNKKGKIRRMNGVMYCAAAVLLISIGLFWMIHSPNPSEKIFAENFTPDIGLPLKMGTANTYGFYEGMLDYKQEKYQDAIDKWLVLLEKEPNSDTLNYFLGVANIALGKTTKALRYLRDQELFEQGIFQEDAAFYAALARIKEGEFEKAETLLKNTPSPKNTELLRELESR